MTEVHERANDGQDIVESCYELENMTGGWFVGAFAPAALHCDSAEVAFKRYRAGDAEAAHTHMIATEVTLIVSGTATMCGRKLSAGDIIVIPPGKSTGFVAITDVSTVVFKTPSVPNDKLVDAEPT